MKIGEFAQACGSSVRMIRFYERLNLISPKRGGNGYRIYDAGDVAVVRKIVLLNKTGVPLKDLALMSDCLRDEPQDFCAALRGRLAERLAAIDGQINDLRQSKALLAELLGK
ncbi:MULTISPECIES: MerR family DNA-binding transcriptional regulator [Eikenella]|uniref:MerR family transcriptional regulator n=1 Tax=Eikenella longinqua TaxID=1795827 RepID=A0A1A9S1Z0_9NEIS|nr:MULTISPECIES: MerR family DNA-binding transcriptional regulator [Eikenella]OAM30820.1 MerR family transcriptional regulator [Eikenella longinqua]